MLRITSLSLLLGLALLVVGLALLSPVPTATGNKTLRMIPEQVVDSIPGSGAFIESGVLHLPVPEDGVAGVPLQLANTVKAQDFPFLHLSIVEPRQGHEVFLTWKRVGEKFPMHRHRVENLERDSLWISTRELPGWSGELSEISLLFTDMDNTGSYGVRDLSLHPSNLQRWFGALSDDWLAYEHWDLVSINSYTGVTQASSFYRTPISATLVLFSLAAYLIFVLLGRKRIRFSWYPVGLIFMFCWLLMDFGWQHRLLLQLDDTRAQFSGLSSSEKLEQGPDAEVIAFVDELKSHIPNRSRIFVESQDGYKGLRTSYYLYPHNVYWHRYAGLPATGVYKTGDLIVTLDAPHIQYRSPESILTFKGSKPIPVDVVMRRPAGSLYRVK